LAIKNQADRFATLGENFGLKQHDRVGIMLPNCPQYMIATFAFRLGATVVNVNPLYTPREILVVAQDSGMRAIDSTCWRGRSRCSRKHRSKT
jgi:long-chain acyl-CoA synthetase